MNAYICSSQDVIGGSDFLYDFLDSEKSNNYDFIIYENISERNIFFTDYRDENLEYFYKLNSKLVKKNIKLTIILSAVPQDYYNIYSHSNINIIYCPFYFINYLIKECGFQSWEFYNHVYKRNFTDNRFDKLILNLNNRPHYHKCVMMDYLSKFGLVDVMTYTWQDDSIEYDYYKFKWWTPKIKSFKMESDFYNCYSILQDNPVFHLVNESEMTHISFSEKVFKPIISGIPFIVFGAKGFHKKLKEYGFELYDEVFDYSFDDFDNEKQRAISICKNFLKLRNTNHIELIQSIYPKIEKNRNYALKIYSDKKFIPKELYDIYEKYIKFTIGDDSMESYGHINQYLF